MTAVIGKKLLVVDDFELNRDMLTRRLRTRGFEVQGASNGEEALKLVDEFGPDLVLLDIMMPDINGYEVLSRLRQKYDPTKLSVIMVTAKDQSQDIVQALDLGADDYVTKPIDFAVVMARIRSQLGRRQAERALRESEARFALAAEGVNDGLWDWDLRNQKVHYSDRWCALLGYSPEEVGDSVDAWYEHVHTDDRDRVRRALDAHLSSKTETFSSEYRAISKDGTYRWMLSRGKALFDDVGTPYRMAGWLTDTSEKVEHDYLTDLPNRGLFLDRTQSAIQRLSRSPKGHGVAVFCIGIDRFRIINESLGHQKGDEMLIRIARRLEALINPGDTLARLGGDEFCILVEEISGIGGATEVARQIQQVMAEPFSNHGGDDIHITCCVGIAVVSEEAMPVEESLRRAHTAMERAKQKGKNHFVMFDDGMSDNMLSVLKIENQLRRALEHNELLLQYQPQINSVTGEIVGAEALVRWQSKELGFISPGRFIPIAEDTGLIVPIGAWILKQACVQAMAWHQQYGLGVRIGVNLSSKQFSDGSILETVKEVLAETQLPPHLLDLELTESLLMKNIERTIQQLKSLHELGVSISVDDFGTGYSSLAYLKRFPIDTLKIDQSFVRDITSTPDDASICKAIISMAHSLRMQVIAEGVETVEHYRFLHQLKCDELQGYYFAKPLVAEAFAELLEEKKNWSPS